MKTESWERRKSVFGWVLKEIQTAWLPWLKNNFGWAERTARAYMQVAEAFKMAPGAVLDVNIEAKALYLLSGNGVSDQTRSEGKCQRLANRQALPISRI